MKTSHSISIVWAVVIIQMGEHKAIDFGVEVDDLFLILIKQNTSEFTVVHNNNFTCTCKFCKLFGFSINEVWKKVNHARS